MTPDQTSVQIALGFLETRASPTTGFLPLLSPLYTLPAPFEKVSGCCDELAGRYHGDDKDCRPWLETEFGEVDPLWESALSQADEHLLENLMTKVSLLCHAYRWQSAPTTPAHYALKSLCLPPGLEQLWSETAGRLGVSRVGLFYTMICNNWRLPHVRPGESYDIDSISDDSIDLIHSWLNPPIHEELRTFVAAALIIEAKGLKVLRSVREVYQCILRDDAQEATYHLMVLGATILALNSAFNRAIKTKRIKPAHFLKYVQPTMIWLLDHGEGPLEGASGPQSCTIQVLDSFFGVSRDSQLGGLLLESRRYMLPRHRTLLEALDETSPVLRRFVAGSGSPRLLEAYNRCLELLRAWRVSHQKRGGLYIKADDSSSSYVSTGLLVQKGDKSALFEQSMEEHIQATDERLLENPWKGKELSFEHLFRFLRQEQKELLRSRTEKLRFEAGESIISQGDLFPGLFVLKSGTASVLKTVGGEERVVDGIGVDEVFGEMSLVENLPAAATIVADVDLEVEQVSLETVYDLISTHRDAESAFFLALAQIISSRLREAHPASLPPSW